MWVFKGAAGGSGGDGGAGSGAQARRRGWRAAASCRSGCSPSPRTSWSCCWSAASSSPSAPCSTSSCRVPPSPASRQRAHYAAACVLLTAAAIHGAFHGGQAALTPSVLAAAGARPAGCPSRPDCSGVTAEAAASEGTSVGGRRRVHRVRHLPLPHLRLLLQGGPTGARPALDSQHPTPCIAPEMCISFCRSHHQIRQLRSRTPSAAAGGQPGGCTAPGTAACCSPAQELASVSCSEPAGLTCRRFSWLDMGSAEPKSQSCITAARAGSPV